MIEQQKGVKGTEQSALHELPGGWVWTKLGAIIAFEYGKGLKADKRENKGNIPVYGSNGIVGYHSIPLIEKPCLIIGRKGAAGYVHISNVPCWAIDTTYYIIPPDELNLVFLYFILSTLNLKSLDKSTAIPGLNRNDAYALYIPLPPLLEQRAIVAKIEQLFSDLDNGIANLKKAQEQLKIYRQAVLKKAFEGELTRKWREEQTDLPSAEELLQQIKEEREKHYQKQLDEWKKAVKEWEDKGKAGKKPSRPKKPKELPPLSEEGLKELPKLPEGWCWVKLDAIGKLFCGQSPSTSEVNTEGYGTLYITGPEQWNGVKIKNDKWTEYPKRIVPEGCIFITVKGAGVGTLFPGVSCTIGRDIYAYRPLEIINFEFVINALRHGIDLVIMKAKGDIPGLSKNHILDHFIGLPSIEEQNKIVCEIETRLSVCDKLEATIAESLQKAEALRQSILKNAFEGKLLNEKELEEARNAPDWEPADKLLERIKTEKEKPGTKKSFLREHSVNSLPK